MIDVKVLINNFRDKENESLGLLQSGYVYKVTKKRATELSKKGIVEIIKTKENKEE